MSSKKKKRSKGSSEAPTASDGPAFSNNPFAQLLDKKAAKKPKPQPKPKPAPEPEPAVVAVPQEAQLSDEQLFAEVMPQSLESLAHGRLGDEQSFSRTPHVALCDSRDVGDMGPRSTCL